MTSPPFYDLAGVKASLVSRGQTLASRRESGHARLGLAHANNIFSIIFYNPQCPRTGNSAPFFASAALNFSREEYFSAKAMMNSARSLSLMPKWFSSSVQILETSDSSSSFCRSSIVCSSSCRFDRSESLHSERLVYVLIMFSIFLSARGYR